MNKLDKIASFSYGVYSIPCGFGEYDETGQLPTDRFAVADPLDGPDGFYLTVETIADAFEQMKDSEIRPISSL